MVYRGGLQNHWSASGLATVDVARGFESPPLRQPPNYTFAAFSLRGLFQYGDLHLGQTRGSPWSALFVAPIRARNASSDSRAL